MNLTAKDIHFRYDHQPLLAGANINVDAGESGFILGPSGAGKSTLLRIIAGLESPTQGSIHLGGEPITHMPAHKRRVGMLFQEPTLFPHLTVGQNVAFGLTYRGIPRSQRAQESRTWLDMVDLAHRADAKVDELSGGQRQRVALARTLAAKPKAVLLDEPFSALDRTLRDALGLRVKTLLHEQGVAALWVTHDEPEAFTLGDRVWRMADGTCVPASLPED